MSPHLPALLGRVAELEPERIVLIKADVYDAGLPVSKVRVPFPSHGQQEKFRVAFGRALAGE